MESKEFLDPFDFIVPIKELKVQVHETVKCYNCNNENSNYLEKRPASSWTDKYMCYSCGCLNYVIFSDKMSGVCTDTIKIFKLHPTKN
jgi:hypothetical protein